MVVATFIKLPSKRLKQWMAPFSGVYDQETVLWQINCYSTSRKASHQFWGNFFIIAVEYANMKWNVNWDLDLVKQIAAQDDSIFEEVSDAPQPIVFCVLRYFLNTIKIHWRVPTCFLLLVLSLTVTYPGIHRTMVNLFQEPPLLLEMRIKS